jgi:hypothetical protein
MTFLFMSVNQVFKKDMDALNVITGVQNVIKTGQKASKKRK